MKKLMLMMLGFGLLLGACASPKPYYETKKGRKKQEYYNDLYYGKQKPFFKDKN
jgi:hypothetical protein